MRSILRAARAPVVGIAALVLLGLTPARATFYFFVNQGVNCPQYTALLSYEDAVANQAAICNTQGYGSAARLMGFASFTRQGLFCAVNRDDHQPMFYSLCKVSPAKARRRSR